MPYVSASWKNFGRTPLQDYLGRLVLLPGRKEACHCPSRLWVQNFWKNIGTVLPVENARLYRRVVASYKEERKEEEGERLGRVLKAGKLHLGLL
jgi:hypothetical protein